MSRQPGVATRHTFNSQQFWLSHQTTHHCSLVHPLSNDPSAFKHIVSRALGEAPLQGATQQELIVAFVTRELTLGTSQVWRYVTEARGEETSYDCRLK